MGAGKGGYLVSYGGISPETKNLDPERNFLYEVGTKWELFNRRVLATAALFQIDKENARVASGPNGSQVVTLNGEQRVQGFELGLGGNISPEWSVFSGFTYLDTEITKSDKPEEVGQEFPNIADTSLSFLTKYAITPKIEVGGMAYYQSSISGGSTAAGSPNLPSYWKFDLLSEYDVTEDVEISFNIKNLLNERYYDSIYRSSSPFAYVAPGRAAYVTVGVKF